MRNDRSNARRARRVALASAALVAWAGSAWLLPSIASAKSGAMPIAHSPKAMGRGGADTAVGGDGALSMLRNPALAADSWGLRADLSLGLLHSRVRFQNDRNDELSAGGVSPVPSFGIVWDPFAPSEAELLRDPELPLDSRFRIGLGIFPLAGGGGESDLKTEVFPEGQTELLDFSVIAIAPTFAFELFPGFSVGIAPQLLIFQLATEGLVSTSGGGFSDGIVRQHRDGNGNPINPPEPLLAGSDPVRWSEVVGGDDPNASTRVVVKDVTGFGVSAVIGARWRILDELTLGFSYQFEGIIPSARGKARLDANRSIASFSPGFEAILGPIFNTFLPDGGANGFAGSYDFEVKNFRTPAVLSLGAAMRPFPNWMIAVDLRYTFWKRAFDQSDVFLTGGTNNDINEINGTGDIATDTKLKWRDSFTFAIGTAYAPTDWLVLRAGYNYGQNPVTEGHASPTSAIGEHGVGLGVGFLVGDLDIDLAYFHSVANQMRIGESEGLQEWNDTAFKAEQHWFYLGVGYQF